MQTIEVVKNGNDKRYLMDCYCGGRKTILDNDFLGRNNGKPRWAYAVPTLYFHQEPFCWKYGCLRLEPNTRKSIVDSVGLGFRYEQGRLS